MINRLMKIIAIKCSI